MQLDLQLGLLWSAGKEHRVCVSTERLCSIVRWKVDQPVWLILLSAGQYPS